MATLTDEQAALFKGKNFGIVATVDDRGLPQQTTNWVDWDGEHVLVNTAEGRAKPRHMRRNPTVSVCLYDHEDPYRYVTVVGKAELTHEGAEEHINELSHRYFGRDYRYVPGERRVIARIRPERVFARGFS